MKVLARLFAIAIVVFAAVTFLEIGTPRAQAPEEPKNLKVLPKNMSRREVIGIMRSFTQSLGVRCIECHVSTKEGSERPEDMDYAADKKESKETARKMMKMLGNINDQIAKMGLKDTLQIRCVTCHRGLKRPETLIAVMSKSVEKDGADTAIGNYRKLREQYYGTGSYDFSPMTLNEVARDVAETRKDYPTAIKLIQLNLEFAPKDANSYAMLGNVQMTSGDKAAAITSLEKALEIDPQHRWAKMQLDQAKGGR